MIVENSMIFYTTYTNSDLTEGRGFHIPIAISETYSTAYRLGKGKYVQGSDCPVNEVEAIEMAGKWYIPMDAVNVIKPTDMDIANEKKRLAIKKAKALGLSENDLKDLQVM